MIKCFLSHSSKDKENYVRKVASLLRPETKIFDEETFEAGMSPSEEIIKGLDETALFVIFISDSALESKWVKDELINAKNRLDSGEISRIYPIIIDDKINHTDRRIPEWMRNGINIQHIKQPKIAARKINSRLREIAWKIHPSLKDREKIYVGRNDKIKKVELRFDDFTKKTPSIFIASGLHSIGRKTFLSQSLKKSNIISESYELPTIQMNSNDSIEDFILKIDDLGFSDKVKVTDLLKTEVSEKIKICSQLLLNIGYENEKILIDDNGSIVQYDGKIVDWFDDIVKNIEPLQKLIICIASRFRPVPNIMYRNDSYYFEELSELEKHERNGLLLRYSKFKNMDLNKEDLNFFSDLLTGFPEQVIYTVDTISDSSVFEAKKNSHLIQEYASDKARVIIEELKTQTEKLDFLYFLSKFEFISFEFIFTLVSENEYYPILNSLLNASICERLGSSGEYVRVNEVIRDFILRSNFGIKDSFSEKLTKHVEKFVKEYSDDNRDISNYLFSIKEALLRGIEIPENIIMPSYFLKTIKELYERGGNSNYNAAIKLSDRVLLNERFMHNNIIKHIYFIKCQALARLKNNDFFAVVRNISEPESSFLHGFFYRISGNQERAIESYNKYLTQKPNDNRAKSELVIIYMQNDEHDKAYELAKEIYQWNTNNPIIINNYLSCLLHKDRNKTDRELINKLLEKLQSIPTEQSQEMYLSAKAKTIAKLDGNISGAYQIIDETVARYPNIVYPILTLADISFQDRNVLKLNDAIEKLERMDLKNSQTYRSYIKYKALFMGLCGDLEEANRFAIRELKGLHSAAMSSFLDRLNQLATH